MRQVQITMSNVINSFNILLFSIFVASAQMNCCLTTTGKYGKEARELIGRTLPECVGEALNLNELRPPNMNV